MAGLLGGIGDFITGSGDYADPNNIDPRYGVPMGDVRQAGINTLGNMSALLLAAGQPMEGSQRAQILAQLGQAGAGFGTDLYNASQRRLMTAQQGEKQAEMQELGVIRERQKADPDGLARSMGVSADYVRSASASDLRAIAKQVQITRATQDPQTRQLTGLQIQKAQRDLSAPERIEVGGGLYERQNGSWTPVIAPKSQGGLEERAQQLIISAQRDPGLAQTPEYAMAYNQVFGPKQVQAFNPETRAMEYQWVTPPVPAGVLPPRGQQAMGASAPAPGQSAPIISRAPAEEKPLTEDQSKATGFAARMIQAHKITDPNDTTDAAKPGFLETVVGPRIGETATNFMRDGERQKYRQAQENWVRANLRKESGAVIGADEMAKEIENYFPRPGDGPEVVAQKRLSRESATQGMLTASGPGAKRGGLMFEPYKPSAAEKIRSMSPQELLTIDPSSLSRAEQAEYLVRLQKLNGGR